MGAVALSRRLLQAWPPKKARYSGNDPGQCAGFDTSYAEAMEFESEYASESPLELARKAEQLEQLARFVGRPAGRTHLFERAAECLAKAALLRAARGAAAEQM